MAQREEVTLPSDNPAEAMSMLGDIFLSLGIAPQGDVSSTRIEAIKPKKSLYESEDQEEEAKMAMEASVSKLMRNKRMRDAAFFSYARRKANRESSSRLATLLRLSYQFKVISKDDVRWKDGSSIQSIQGLGKMKSGAFYLSSTKLTTEPKGASSSSSASSGSILAKKLSAITKSKILA